MATQAKITIRVGSTRGASTVQYSTVGTYVSTSVNTYNVSLTDQPILPTTSQKDFWLAVLAIVQAEITAAG